MRGNGVSEILTFLFSPMERTGVRGRDGLIETLRKILTGVEEAYVFGSYADNTRDEYSDLDIVIVKNTAKEFFYRFQEFPELYELGVPIDLLVYTPDEFNNMKESNNPFVENIIRTGIKIV